MHRCGCACARACIYELYNGQSNHGKSKYGRNNHILCRYVLEALERLVTEEERGKKKMRPILRVIKLWRIQYTKMCVCARSRACSSAIATLTVARGRSFPRATVKVAFAYSCISKAASVRVFSNSSSGGSDILSEPPVKPPGPWPGSSHAHCRWTSDVP